MLSFGTDDANDGTLTAHAFALAGLSRLAVSCTTLDASVRNRLRAVPASLAAGPAPLLVAFTAYLEHPEVEDVPLLALARQFDLTPLETLTVELAVAAEEDVVIGHVLSHLQQPLASSRPTVGLLAQAYGDQLGPRAVHVLGQGQAVRCGLLRLSNDDVPLPERTVRIPLPSSMGLRGIETPWPGTAPVDRGHVPMPLGRTGDARAAMYGERLRAARVISPVLVVRSGDAPEARAAAERACEAAGLRPVLVATDQLGGMAPWLFLNGFVPVFAQSLAPGERRPLPAIPSYTGPVIVLTGPDGDFETDDRVTIDWRIDVPPPEEREELWSSPLADRALAHRVAFEHRHTAGRIAALAAKVRDEIGPRSPGYAEIRTVARRGESIGLGALAELIPDEIEDDALVVPSALREELDALVVRCRLRERFPALLGPSIKARYRPSVRALFVGPSGTGKTLAAAWLATRLGIPLSRVDLSAITSKYIGETEKNLSQLFSRAEQSEVVLLFDEADSLFGKRTDIQDANDRFANAQTNYLLQRMESYDGIIVLTSNGRSRFDAAFTRRFDAILTFPSPGAAERRALWATHLGTAHDVTATQLNLLSAVADISGGQIRNAVLGAAVDAARHGGAIGYAHVLAGVATEYRKLSRQLPDELKQHLAPETEPC